jgi:hypothetical protein
MVWLAFQPTLVVGSLPQEVNNHILIDKIGLIIQLMFVFFGNVFLVG